jgi:ectoine hydroxylase-related dioxygenase (phytanoyl-CoA dioxygenase family)
MKQQGNHSPSKANSSTEDQNTCAKEALSNNEFQKTISNYCYIVINNLKEETQKLVFDLKENKNKQLNELKENTNKQINEVRRLSTVTDRLSRRKINKDLSPHIRPNKHGCYL